MKNEVVKWSSPEDTFWKIFYECMWMVVEVTHGDVTITV